MQLHAGVSFIWCCVCVAGPLALFCPGKGLASINEQNEGIDIDSLILWTRKAQLRDVILKPCFLLRLKWLTVIFSLDRTKIHVGFDTTLQNPLQIIFDDQGKIYNIKGTCKCYLRKFKLFSGWKKKHFCNFRTFVHAIWKPDLLYRGEKHHVHLVVKHNLLDRYLPPSKRSVFELRVSYAFKGFWHRTEFSGSHVDMSTLGPQRLAMQKSALLMVRHCSTSWSSVSAGQACPVMAPRLICGQPLPRCGIS